MAWSRPVNVAFYQNHHYHHRRVGTFNEGRTSHRASTKIHRGDARITVAIASTHTNSRFPLWDRFSSYLRLIRVVAWIRRWFHRPPPSDGNLCVEVPSPNHTIRDAVLSATELKQAELTWIRAIQVETTAHEMVTLRKGGLLSINHPLAALRPSWDRIDQLIRVTGRLQYLDADGAPILVPKNHPVTTLLIRQCHTSNLHADFHPR